MIQFKPGSHVHRLVTLLSYTGEFPAGSLYMLGNERVFKALVIKLILPQTICVGSEQITCRLLNLTGKGRGKTIRLNKGALGLLDFIDPKARNYYMNSFWNHRFPGDAAHIERNHRVAETAALCMRSGINTIPYRLPKLQNQQLLKLIPERPVFYLAKDIKKTGENEMNKTMFTRMTGAVFSSGSCFAVYNTRSCGMKWRGMGEYKALNSLTEIARMNSEVKSIDSAILIGRSADIAFRTLDNTENTQKQEFRFDSIYRHIHFIPSDEFGIRLLRLLTLPNLKENILSLLFDHKDRTDETGAFEYDAHIYGTYILSHLDGDIARLIRFRDALEVYPQKSEIICFPEQAKFISELMSDKAEVRTIDIHTLESELNTRII